MFLQHGRDFKQVELQVKRAWESKRSKVGIEADVTKTMLKEKYHWTELGAHGRASPVSLFQEYGHPCLELGKVEREAVHLGCARRGIHLGGC